MAKKQLPPPKRDKWSSIGTLCALVLAMCCTTALIVDRFGNHELICAVKTVDQITGLVILECAK